jgi:hypothetical protein
MLRHSRSRAEPALNHTWAIIVETFEALSGQNSVVYYNIC